MTPSASSLSLRPDLSLKFVGGDVSLDLINTVDWTQVGQQNDRLHDFGRVLEWAERSQSLPPGDVRLLRQHASRHGRTLPAVMDEVRRVRFVLKRVLTEFALGAVSPAAAGAFNEALARGLAHLAVELTTTPRRGVDAQRAVWSWQDSARAPECAIWPALFAAATLLTSPDAARIRVCAGPDCGWMFVDRSRNGLRRWCEMATCGTLQKTRTRREQRT